MHWFVISIHVCSSSHLLRSKLQIALGLASPCRAAQRPSILPFQRRKVLSSQFFLLHITRLYLQVLPDDVEVKLLGGSGLHCPSEQLHAVLHLPHAYPVHRYGVRRLGPGPTLQQDQCRHHMQVGSHSPSLLVSLSCFAN